MNKTKIQALTLLGLVVFLSGCTSSLTSIKLTEENFQQGLVYYLPARDVIVSVTRNKKGELSTSIVESPTYPDLKHPYRIDYRHNLVGKNTMKIGIGTNGLLTTANSTVESKIGTTLSNLASSLGTFQPMVGDSDAEKCEAVGTYSEVFQLDTSALPRDQNSRCGVKVTISPWGNDETDIDDSDAKFASKAQSGLYYRQNRPFLVEVAWDFNEGATRVKGSTAKLIMSPSGAEVRFLPIKETVFAGNVATLGFENGIPTKYEQDVDSEIAAFLSLPATVIASYFEAIGKVFDNNKNAAEKERQLIEAQLKLAEKERGAELCRTAIAQDDSDAIKENCK